MSSYLIVLESKFAQLCLLSGGLNYVRLGATSHVPSAGVHSVVVTEVTPEI